MDTPAGERKPKRDLGSLVFLIAIGLVAAFLVFRPTPTAPVPTLFESGSTSLESAIDRADSEGKVVFAVATADWCGPCQSYKGGALTDERVMAWVEANAEPLYLDVDRSPEDAGALGVRGIPATYLIREGQVVAQMSGNTSAGELLAWLEANAS